VKRADAEKILTVDIANIIKKARDGKTLTQAERRLVGEQVTDAPPELSVKDLCEAIGISKPTFYEWKKDPLAPTCKSVDAWREYRLKRQTLGKGNGKFTETELYDLKGQLLAERALREKAERKLKEIQLKKAEEGWVPMETAVDTIKRVLEPLARMLDVLPKAWSGQVNPTDPDHAEIMLREMVFDVKTQMHAKRGENISKRKGVK
jgi:transcriptional regulator with XRE-family HTH domain